MDELAKPDSFLQMVIKFLKLCFFAVLLWYLATTVVVILVLRHPLWHSHLLRFIHSAWAAFVAEQMGSTSPGFINSLWAAVVGVILMALGIWYLQGLDAMKKHVIETAAMGILGLITVLVLVYGTQFIWEVAQFGYNDHESLVARLNAPKVPCPSCPSCPTCPPSKVIEKVSPHDCKISNVFTNPNPKFPQAKSETFAIIHCNYKIEAPFCVKLELDKEVLAAGIWLPDQSITMVDGGDRNGKIATACVDSPSVPVEGLITINLKGATDDPPRVLKGNVRSK